MGSGEAEFAETSDTAGSFVRQGQHMQEGLCAGRPSCHSCQAALCHCQLLCAWGLGSCCESKCARCCCRLQCERLSLSSVSFSSSHVMHGLMLAAAAYLLASCIAMFPWM